jgi:hypothetical protein
MVLQWVNAIVLLIFMYFFNYVIVVNIYCIASMIVLAQSYFTSYLSSHIQYVISIITHRYYISHAPSPAS